VGISNEWQEVKYDEVFEEEIRGLNRRLQSDSALKIDDLQAILNSFYILDGTDQGGNLQNTILSARIAAYEHFITQWSSKGL
jgi:DNA helicase IV